MFQCHEYLEIRALLKPSPHLSGDRLKFPCSHYTLSPLSLIKTALLKSVLKENCYSVKMTRALSKHNIVWKRKHKHIHLEGKAKESLPLEAGAVHQIGGVWWWEEYVQMTSYNHSPNTPFKYFTPC